jgi:hypothetical protein
MVGDSNVGDGIGICRGLKRVTRQMAGLSARRHLVPFGFSGTAFDLDLICFFFAVGAPFDLV